MIHIVGILGYPNWGEGHAPEPQMKCPTLSLFYTALRPNLAALGCDPMRLGLQKEGNNFLCNFTCMGQGFALLVFCSICSPHLDPPLLFSS